MRRLVLAYVKSWAAFFVVWFVFTTDVSRPEVLVGLAAAALAALGMQAVQGLRFIPFRAPLRWWLEAWRVPGMILDGTWVLLKVLLLKAVGREIRGEVKRLDFAAPGPDPQSAAQRALATIYTTTAPNFIVLDIDRHRELMLYHQVMGNEIPEVTRRLGARTA